ncbi:MAG: inositol monophosphatase family protein [Planctomycetota bacterium]|jgi:myo-inositol-1(or 4)-monophosphatase
MDLDKIALRNMLETAIVAARLAGQKALEEIEYTKAAIKDDGEMVTQTDLRCQQIIIDQIKQRYPDHGFIAEEGGGTAIFKQPPRGSEDLWWVIDPIDGTNNFAHQCLLFTVSIALCCQGQPVVGVVFEPATDSMFTAVKDDHAYLNGRRINAGTEKISPNCCIGLSSNFETEVPHWASHIMQKTKYRNLGSAALQIAYVAKASFVATICPTGIKLWDIAAAALIAQAAGARVTDWQGKDIFPIDLPDYVDRKLQLIVANQKVHPELLELLKSQ